MSLPTAHAPIPSLLTSLDRAGWGDLTGAEWQGVRTTLRALAAQLPHKSGQGWSTAPQIALSAGLTERWVRRCLNVLEDLGIVEWKRGGASRGEPLPSYFRIVKTALVDLIRAARPMKAAAEAARRTATRARIAHLRFAKPQRRRRSGASPELSTSPPTPKGGGTAVPLPPDQGAQMRPVIPITCEHDGDAGVLRDGTPRCPMCRRKAEQDKFNAAAHAMTVDYQARAAGDDTLWTE